jgi:hypothetical protein
MCRELYFVHLPTKIHPKGSIGHGAATQDYQSLRSGRRCSEMVRKGVGGSFTVGIVYYIVESQSGAIPIGRCHVCGILKGLMLVGHYAVALIAKRTEPKINLGTLILAAMWAYWIDRVRVSSPGHASLRK